jgi:hypothetical protein
VPAVGDYVEAILLQQLALTLKAAVLPPTARIVIVYE